MIGIFHPHMVLAGGVDRQVDNATGGGWRGNGKKKVTGDEEGMEIFLIRTWKYFRAECHW